VVGHLMYHTLVLRSRKRSINPSLVTSH
jgi:hypothetical protein